MRRSVLTSTVVAALIGSAAPVTAAPVMPARPAVTLALPAVQADPVGFRYYGFRGGRTLGYRGFYGGSRFHGGFGFRRNPFISRR